MKKIQHHTILLSLLLLVTLLAACSDGKKKNTTRFETISTVTRADTLRVFDETQKFMELLKTNKVDSAISLLCDVRNDSAFQLTEARKQQLKKQFRQFPVIDYELETSEFESHEYATATYRYKFMENPTTDPNYPVHTRLTIEVTCKSGKFRLVLHDESFITR